MADKVEICTDLIILTVQQMAIMIVSRLNQFAEHSASNPAITAEQALKAASRTIYDDLNKLLDQQVSK